MDVGWFGFCVARNRSSRKLRRTTLLLKELPQQRDREHAESENVVGERIRTFRDLEVWQAGMDLAAAVYRIVDKLPKEERYGLSAQMRRAVVSIPSNAAEGHSFRSQPRAYQRYVRIALGSVAELETQIELTATLRLLDDESLSHLRARATRTGQLLHGLLRALRSCTPRPA